MLVAMIPRLARVLTALVATVVLLTPTVMGASDTAPPTPPASGEQALVVDVIDGDTIRIERDDGTVERVRYIGIDTPEIGHAPGERDEPFGREAAQANAQLVADRSVLLERDVSDRDRYERLLRYVWVELPEGWLMVNGELAARGLAEVRAYAPDTRHHDWLSQLHDEAVAAGLGMYDTTPESERDLRDLLEIIAELIGWD